MTARAIVLFAHGAKDPQWAEPMRAIQARVRDRVTDVAVELAFLERMTPTLSEALAALVQDGAREVTVVPLFLAMGGHIKEDLPQLIAAERARYPSLQITSTLPIGEDAALLDAIASWVVGQAGA